MNVIDVGGTGNPSLSAALLIDRVYIDPAARDSTGVTNASIPFSAGTTFTAIELPDPVSVTFCALTVSARKGFEKRSAFKTWLLRVVSNAALDLGRQRGRREAFAPVRESANGAGHALDWSDPKHYLHDLIATDRRKPTVNANGKIYGAPEESTDMVPVLDPKTHTASQIKHPYRDAETPSSTQLPKGTSAYWGDEAIWDGHTSIHNPIMDREGRVWFTARIRPAVVQPKFCTDGSIASSKVAPLKESPRHLSMYDPKANKWSLIDTCFPTHHLYFDPKNPTMLWTSAGGPGSGVVGWLDTKK